MKLTDRTVANLKPRTDRRFELFDDAVPGLAIRVNQGGSKAWVLFYRERLADASGGFVPGTRLRRWTLGTYPALTLAGAHTKAQRALRELDAKGTDPAAGKREARAGKTFGDLADDYIKRYAMKQKKSWQEDQRTLDADILPHWKPRPVKAITRRDVHEVIDGIVDRGAPIMANRALALISAVFNYGLSKDWIDGNPASRIPKQPETSRDRVLKAEELKALWTALESVKTLKRVTDEDSAPAISPMIARGLQMILLTAQRPGEVFNMRWADVDEAGAWWTIPGPATKNGEAHRVPLTKRAIALLKEAREHGPGDNVWVFAGQQGASVAARAKKAAANLRAAGSVDFDFHRHDLRRTVATGMAREGISRGTISQVLNHVDGGSRATVVYDRYSYDTEKRTALEAWARRINAIIADEKERRDEARAPRQHACIDEGRHNQNPCCAFLARRQPH